MFKRLLPAAAFAIASTVSARPEARPAFELDVRQLTHGPATHLFGYIGHVGNVPWSGDDRFVLALRTPLYGEMPDGDDPADVVLIDTAEGDAARKVDECRAWNPQQGTMFYWNPQRPHTQFFFNDRDRETGEVFTVLFDISKGGGGERLREYRFEDTPIGNSGVAQKGGHFYAINYARMARLRPVTGYKGARDWTEGVAHPEGDGVFRIEIESGERRLLVSFKKLAEVLGATGHYSRIPPLFINHTLANRENDRVFFFARAGWDGGTRPRINQGFVMNPDGSGLKMLKQHIGGHPEWAEGNRMIGRVGDRQVVYDVDSDEVVETWGDRGVFPDPEGDIALSPDGERFVNGFKDKKKQSIFYTVYRRRDGASVRSEGFNIGKWVSGDLRQDPSPCWNRNGDKLLVPSVADDGESRQLHIISIGEKQTPDELRRATSSARTHSYSRAWFDWELRLRRYIDGGRRDADELDYLAAFFRGAIFDRYRALAARGEGDMFYIFHTSMDGDKAQRHFGDKVFARDVHGGGGHGGWGGHARMLVYEELVRQGILTDDEQSLFRKIVEQSLRKPIFDPDRLELGANNRPYKNTGGLAAVVRIYPDLPNADELRAWIDRQWRELTEHGDIFEVNHFPYGGLHLTGLMEIATQTGKIKEPEHRELIKAVADRYLLFNHGMGVRGNPNSGANVHEDIESVFADPWHTTYYGDKLVPDFWYRAAQEFESPEFLWAAVQTSIGPRPPQDSTLLERWGGAYARRFAWFVEREIEPKAPGAGASLSLLSPTKHKIRERLYLGEGRERGDAFASFYLYDRNNEYMHCFDDAMGHLYEYCVDGAKLLGSSGKYNGIFLGQAYYDQLMVRHPSDSFPAGAEGRLDQAHGVWRRASCSLPDITHSRTGPDSGNWRYVANRHDTWRWERRHDPVGASAANMDGLVYLNNEYSLKGVTIRVNGAPESPEAKPDVVWLSDLRLSGPGGIRTLHSLANLESVIVSRTKGGAIEAWENLDPSVLAIVDEGGRESLKLAVEPGYRYAVHCYVSASFDLANDYTRVSFDFKTDSTDLNARFQKGWRYGQTRPPALVPDMLLNDRTFAPSHDVRGGILEPESVRAENRHGDAFGSFTYRNYFGGQSIWQRDTVLTREGVLVVRDVFTAGAGTDGYRAGPVWCLRADGRWLEGWNEHGHPWRRFENAEPASGADRHWFDAPAYDHAAWQGEKKRLLVYFHPQDGQTCGQLQHRSTPDVSHHFATNSTWASAVVTEGTRQLFLSVLQPFAATDDAEALAAELRSEIKPGGEVSARLKNITITIGADRSWGVDRG